MRNRRYVQRKGPLVIYGNDAGIRWVGAGRVLFDGGRHKRVTVGDTNV